MSNPSIGNQISVLRKEKGGKQEELAAAVGVSTQAVSKWECGGLPDTELLPKIADYLGVSIDKLFGRSVGDYGDLKKEVAKHLASLEQDSRMNEAMEFGWAILTGLHGMKENLTILERLLERNNSEDSYVHSQILYSSGISLFSMIKKLPYFVLMPEPENGWEKGLFEKEEYVTLFKLLSDPDVMNSLYMLYKRENKPFTPKLLEKNLHLAAEKAEQVLQSLMQYGLVYQSDVELDDTIQTIYSFSPNPAFVAVLAISKELIKRPNKFMDFSNARNNKPYL